MYAITVDPTTGEMNTEVIDEAKREWADALGANMGADRIKTGIDKCRRELDWPPSIAQFLARAKSPPAAHRQYKALPKPGNPDKQIRHQSCRAMQDILAKIEPGELTLEHRIMLQNHNPELLARIDAKRATAPTESDAIGKS